MAGLAAVRSLASRRPAVVTAILSLVGYVLVLGTFAGIIPFFPQISREAVIFLGDAIAVVNAAALTAILLGVRYIKRDAVAAHRRAMLTAFTLILLFLVLYLLKVGGGFEKAIDASGIVWWLYIIMLAVHILLSAISLPVVLHAVVLGLTHTSSELRDTIHARVGRIAVVAWSVSLFLGLVTYVLLNHVYGWTPRAELLWLLAVPANVLTDGQ
jgi:putative membrane protein